MGAPEKPCGKCIHYRRSKKGRDFERRDSLPLLIRLPKKPPPQWYGACIKNEWYVSANMSGCDDWETRRDLSCQWRDDD
jgi:hypothetical protein